MRPCVPPRTKGWPQLFSGPLLHCLQLHCLAHLVPYEYSHSGTQWPLRVYCTAQCARQGRGRTYVKVARGAVLVHRDGKDLRAVLAHEHLTKCRRDRHHATPCARTHAGSETTWELQTSLLRLTSVPLGQAMSLATSGQGGRGQAPAPAAPPRSGSRAPCSASAPSASWAVGAALSARCRRRLSGLLRGLLCGLPCKLLCGTG